MTNTYFEAMKKWYLWKSRLYSLIRELEKILIDMGIERRDAVNVTGDIIREVRGILSDYEDEIRVIIKEFYAEEEEYELMEELEWLEKEEREERESLEEEEEGEEEE